LLIWFWSGKCLNNLPQFPCNHRNKLDWNVSCLFFYKLSIFVCDWKSKMAATTWHSLIYIYDLFRKCIRIFFSDTTSLIKSKLWMNDHCMALYKKNTSQTVIKMKQNNNFITKVNVEIYTEYCIIWLLHIFLNAQIYYFFVEDCGEWDISLRGRIRKRRIIPNNVEDQGLSKKRKGDSLPLTSTHVPNILSHGKPIQATANMISLVTSSPSQSGGQSPGHLLLHTSGGQTYYTGLNEQSLSSLRMLSHSKQTAHPIIQQLLRQPGMTSPRPLVNTTVSSTSQSKSCSIYFTMSVRL
jgi:hypothetical protein